MMRKRILQILVLIVYSSFLLTSCGLDYRSSLDECLHNKIELIYEGDDNVPSHIVYMDNKYMLAETMSFISADMKKTDALLSWNGHRYLGYVEEYYSYTSEEPLFIYYKSWFFWREDYDYLTDTFLVGDTGAEIVLNDMMCFAQKGIDFVSPVKVVLYSKQCPRIKTILELEQIDNQWYISLQGSQDIWIASDEFVNILSQNGLI